MTRRPAAECLSAQERRDRRIDPADAEDSAVGLALLDVPLDERDDSAPS